MLPHCVWSSRWRKCLVRSRGPCIVSITPLHYDLYACISSYYHYMYSAPRNMCITVQPNRPSRVQNAPQCCRRRRVIMIILCSRERVRQSLVRQEFAAAHSDEAEHPCRMPVHSGTDRQECARANFCRFHEAFRAHSENSIAIRHSGFLGHTLCCRTSVSNDLVFFHP